MGPVTGLVLYAVIWFLTLFVVLPIRLETQGDRGEVVPGTHRSSPANLNMRRKALITTVVAFAIWAVIAVVLVFGLVSLEDIDVWHRLRRSGG